MKPFGKDESAVIKGIAILMMLFHHCFGSVERFLGYDVSFAPFGQDFAVELSSFFKICVSIFAFITGYGLSKSFEGLQKRAPLSRQSLTAWVLGRLVKTLSGYWFVFVPALFVCQLLNGRTVSVFCEDGLVRGGFYLLLNFLGLQELFGTPSLNATWWYMSAAVVFVFIVPLFCVLLDKIGFGLTAFALIALPRLLGTGYLDDCSPLMFFFPVLLGVFSAKKDLLARWASWRPFSSPWGSLLKFAAETGLLAALYCSYHRLPSSGFWEYKWGIIPFAVVLYCFEFLAFLPVLRQVWAFLGRHSMNIFYLHTFIRFYYLDEITYSFGHFLLIVLFLLGASLLLSLLVQGLKKLIRYEALIQRLIGRIPALLSGGRDKVCTDPSSEK